MVPLSDASSSDSDEKYCSWPGSWPEPKSTNQRCCHLAIMPSPFLAIVPAWTRSPVGLVTVTCDSTDVPRLLVSEMLDASDMRPTGAPLPLSSTATHALSSASDDAASTCELPSCAVSVRACGLPASLETVTLACGPSTMVSESSSSVLASSRKYSSESSTLPSRFSAVSSKKRRCHVASSPSPSRRSSQPLCTTELSTIIDIEMRLVRVAAETEMRFGRLGASGEAATTEPARPKEPMTDPRCPPSLASSEPSSAIIGRRAASHACWSFLELGQRTQWRLPVSISKASS
mmetsp:Transcript_34649/g.95597  ORF Transcript_34649/g.95597 Transcript_34649/m.95597 type:complete len:290 (-) Transcript_34649:2576-3445(-)